MVLQLFKYNTLVELLLHIIMEKEQEGFVQRIGIYLMNSLACQVNDAQKEILGNLGIIEVYEFLDFFYSSNEGKQWIF